MTESSTAQAPSTATPDPGPQAGRSNPARPSQGPRDGKGRGANPSGSRPGNRGNGPTASRARPAPKPLHPVLARLADWHPALFGARLLPLKRGILQDLLAAHPQELSKDELKTALGLHTRSTRYLTAMASGLPRHDLSGQSVESVAPEHRFHALVEVFKRRQQRTEQDLSPELRQRMLDAAEASGLAPLDYAQRVRTGNEQANALLDAAMAEIAERLARDLALLQAFEASGKTVTAFADDHGLHPIEAAAMLNRARARRDTPQQAAASPEA